MNDRFKFRVYFKGSEYAKAGYQDLSRKDVIYSLKSDGQIIRNVVYECQQEGHEGGPCNMPFEPNNDLYDIQFCTGLKDKNGKLIYELDYIKYKKETYKLNIDKFLGITLTNILNGDIIVMDDLILFDCEVISNEFECNTKI